MLGNIGMIGELTGMSLSRGDDADDSMGKALQRARDQLVKEHKFSVCTIM